MCYKIDIAVFVSDFGHSVTSSKGEEHQKYVTVCLTDIAIYIVVYANRHSHEV